MVNMPASEMPKAYDPEPVEGPLPRLAMSPAMTIVLASTLAGVILLGLYPNPLVSVTTYAVLSLK